MTSTLVVLAVALAAIAGLVALAVLLVRLAAAKAAEAARAETRSEMDRAATEAERRAGEVLASPRSGDDTARRLRDGTF